MVTVRSSWAGIDGLPTAVRAWVSAPVSMRWRSAAKSAVSSEGRGDDEFRVGGVAEETGARGVDAPVAFDLFCYRFGQGPGSQGGLARWSRLG